MANVGIREWLAIGGVIASGQLARFGGKPGPLVRFENAFSKYMGVKHTLTVSSGTASLISALAAAGVGPGDEVLVPAYTWIATAAAPLAVGAVPVLVDIDETLTIDPLDLERRITPRTRAIIPVHMANMVCDMDAIMRIARKHNLVVIEDACQAVGALYKGRRVGTIGDIGAFSFNQFKNINVGEGGAIVTNDDRYFARARLYHDIGSVFRHHDDTYNEPAFVGVNFKASQIQGAMLNVQLSKLKGMLRRMRRRRDLMARILASEGMHIGPHNDPKSAIGLHIVFKTAEEAKAFAQRRLSIARWPYDSGRHVYTNWQPVLDRRSFHARMNPHSWASREIDYSETTCKRTLDILRRTCIIKLGEQFPLPLMLGLTYRLTRLKDGGLAAFAAQPSRSGSVGEAAGSGGEAGV